jgi:hypothetical protein
MYSNIYDLLFIVFLQFPYLWFQNQVMIYGMWINDDDE